MTNEQLSLGLETSLRLDRVYFALRPEAGAARAMTEAARQCRLRHGLSGRLYGAERLHVSLSSVESPRGFRRDDVAAALRAAAAVRAVPFPVTFDRIRAFYGRPKRPIVLCCSEGSALLAALRDTLRRALVKAGLWHGPSQFEPHVTLLWDRRGVPESRLAEPIRWTVEDFVLVRSFTGQRRQIDLGRWRLAPE